MNGLLVCAAPADGAAPFLARIAGAYQLIVAVDGGADLCLDAGVEPSLLVGDFDSASPSTLDAFVSRGIPFARFPADKDATDLQLALAQARDRGCTTVSVTAATAGRLDHTLGVLSALASSPQLEPQIVEPALSGWLLDAQARNRLTLNGDGAGVSLIPWGGPATVSASGVKWPLHCHELRTKSTLGVSNLINNAESADIQVHEGMLYVLSAGGARPPASATR